ncbi:DMT family transporter [Paenibacillus macquariensis]|uniref:Permease of the drug/metabolite transporter (DMT) superfamily n=1 Tax=Paenibacillus macquariensis TaxID=948756 RepID=A0ABY1JZ99_9BACL|nr:DMT family transporter [Paenibacillus macquariensis]MEC0091256.1 DMT family transporter [Paenibacillus macquariensis]OAB37951.1 multidrug transporter [Paenibacillus macquariensis subsp. macquariensis]SIR02961.1 Permease of the drug/metabolite transporter (DMT) superfamily [Paenibacillus macquariensis]
MKKSSSPIPIIIPLLIGVIAVSFSAIFVKWSSAPASIQGMYRLLFAVLIMLPFGIRRVSEFRAVSYKNWILLGVSGFFLALHFLLWMGSLKYTTVSSSTIILALEPVFIWCGAYFIFKERISSLAKVGMLIAVAGAALIGWGDVGISSANLYGDLLSFLGTMAVAVHMLIGQKLMSQVSVYVYNMSVFFSAVVVFALYNVIMGVSFTNYNDREWGIFLLLAIVPTVFGHMLFNWLLQYISATTVSMSILGEPIGASLLAFILLNETMSWIQISGGLMAIAGMILFMRVTSRNNKHVVTN